jgi:hypothetical protein
LKTETLAAAAFMTGIVLTGFQVVDAQVLDRDVEAPAPGVNGTASAGSPNVSIDISPSEPLPVNGTVTMSLEDVVDTNMNEIPPQGVTVVINNEAVTVTNQEVTIEETETEPSQVTVPFSPGAPAQSPSEEDGSGSGDGSGDDDGGDDDGVVVGNDDEEADEGDG